MRAHRSSARNARVDAKGVVIRAVCGRCGWRDFKRVHQVVYRAHPCGLQDQSDDFEALIIGGDRRTRVNAQAYIAYAGRSPVGRIVVIEDGEYNAHHQDHVACFGFYEAVDSDPVAFGLFDAAAMWAREKSLTRLVGPLNPSLVHSAGLLTNGFDRPALVGMPYNPAYYPRQVSSWGMQKAKDLHSYRLAEPAVLVSNRHLWRKWQTASTVTFRSMDSQCFEREVETARHLYNAAFREFWGFTPRAQEEFLRLANGFKPILDKALVVFAERDGKAVGFLMAIPDINQALAKASRWRNAFARDVVTMWHWKGPGRQSTMSSARVDMLMVHPDFAGTGIAGSLIFEVFDRLNAKGYSSVEAAPVLEGTAWFRTFKNLLDADLDRVHRVYEKELAAPGTFTNR